LSKKNLSLLCGILWAGQHCR